MKAKLLPLLLLSLITLNFTTQSDIIVKLIQEEPCLSGFNCTITLRVINMDGNIKLAYARLITPWGSFPKKLNWISLGPGDKVDVRIPVRVDRSALPGHSMVTPVIAYLKEGEIGFNYFQGNTSLVLVRKPKINVSIYISPVKDKFVEGEPISLIANYVVRGIPEGIPLNLYIALDQEQIEEFLLKEDSGNLTFSLPSPGAGDHNITLKLCYQIGCTSKNVIVKVEKKSVTLVDKGPALEEIKSAKREFEEAYDLYMIASNDTLPLDVENITSMLALADSSLKEAEKIILNESITLAEVLNAKEKAEYSRNISLRVKSLILRSYNEAIRTRVETINRILNESYRILRADKVKEYKAKIDSIWEEFRTSLERGDPSSAYRKAIRALEGLQEDISTDVQEARREAQSIMVIMVPLLLIIMVSTTTIIIRLWRGKLGG